MQKENKVSKLTRFLILVPILLILVIVSAIIINKNSSIVDIAKTDEENIKAVTSADGKWEYTVTDENSKTIRVEYYHTNQTENVVNIPSIIDGYTVTSLNTSMLWGSGCDISSKYITEITIPSTVINVMDGKTFNSTGLQNINVDINNPIYSSENGILFNKDKTKLVRCPTKKTNISIPTTVTSIQEHAFFYCTSLTSIEIPSSVTTIESGAFQYCKVLTSVKIPSSVTSIKSNVFGDCTNLTNIEIPSSVTELGQYAFYNCKSLTNIEIPSSVTTINSSAFKGCSNLTSIEIPSSVTELDSGVFENCTNLTNVKIPASIERIKSSTFENCSSLTNVEISPGITRIDSGAFENCTNLTSIKIPESVTWIEDNAFKGDTNLTIYCYPDSQAYWYAKRNSIKYEKIDLSNMTIKTNPTKMNYVQSFEDLNLSGGELEITFADNYKTIKRMTAFEVKANGFSNSTPGTVPVTITYEGKSVLINVTVIAKALSGINVKTNPTKMNYVQSYENLDLTGGELTLIYNDNNSFTEKISMLETGVTTSGFSNSAVGRVPVTITYGGKSTTLNVTIVAKTLSEISIKTNPTKTNYVQGLENLDLSGGELTLTYNNNNNWKETVSMKETGVTTSGFSNSTVGTVPVTITYGGKSTTLNVTILAKTLSGISIKTNPTKINYIQSFENLDLTGGELKLIYNNNNSLTETISMNETGVTTSGFSNSTVGTVPVTITYGGKSTTLNVTILAKTLSGISIKTNPTKMNYIQSFENLDLAGGELTLTYNNNNNWKETVSMRETGVTTSGFSNSTVGTVPVTITYGGKNTTLNITILAKTLSGISIKTNPTKMSYKQNIENLDLTGGELTLTYNSNNNWTETISMKEAGVTTSGFNNSTPGTVPVTITYGGKSTTLNVTVTEKVLTGISIKTKPAKTSYKKDNEDLDLTGGIITLKYDDNTTEDIAMTSTQVEVTGFSNTTLGKKVLTVKYGNKSTTYEIEIICNINYEPTPDGEAIIITGGDKDNPNIVIPEEINGKPVTDIGSGAFKDRDDLESIEIPDSVINIADDAFDGSEDTIIICNPGSAAEEFAKDHDMSYIYKDKIITGISVKTNPIKMNYMKELENLDLTGGRLTVKYEEEGLTSVLRMTSKGVTATGFDNTEIGQNTITVSYDGKSTTFEVTIEEKPSILLGDISGDGVVDSTDLLLMKRHIIAGTKTEWILTGNEFTRGDMNSDGTIDSTDLLLLKRKIINE